MTEAVATVTEAKASVETKTFEGTIENAYGRELETPISFIGEYEHVNAFGAIPAKEQPDNDAILALVNSKRKANARQKAMQSALDDAKIVKPTLESDVDLQVSTIAKGLTASGKYSKDQATALARQMLGLA